MACATTTKSSLDGLTRLKQLDAHSTFTTILEAFLPEKVENRWEELTVDSKTVPPVEDLIAFIRQRAAMPQYEDKITPTPPEKNNQKSTQPNHTHVATAPPATTPSSNPLTKGKEATPPSARSSYPCRYTCPLCSENHYPFFCSVFENYSVTQRKDHVKTHSLCSNCLKPGHTASICRSTFKCRTCNGDHSSLLHEEETPTSTPVLLATANATNISPASPCQKEKLVMTSKVLLTGPTGLSIVARAVLDPASNISIITTEAMKKLALQPKEASVYIQGVGSPDTNTHCNLTDVTVSSLYKVDWSQAITAATMPAVTREHPQHQAKGVRNLPHIKDKHLADNQFDVPGKVDILLGLDIWANILLPGLAKGPPVASHTVFGWAIAGSYTPDEPVDHQSTPVYYCAFATHQRADHLLPKPCELEETSKTPQLLPPEEQKKEDAIIHKSITISSPVINVQMAAEDSVPTPEDTSKVLGNSVPSPDAVAFQTTSLSEQQRDAWNSPPEAMQPDVKLPAITTSTGRDIHPDDSQWSNPVVSSVQVELQPPSASSLTTCWLGVTQPGAPTQGEGTGTDNDNLSPPACSLTTCWLEPPEPGARSPAKWIGTTDKITTSLSLPLAINNQKPSLDKTELHQPLSQSPATTRIIAATLHTSGALSIQPVIQRRCHCTRPHPMRSLPGSLHHDSSAD